MEDLRDFHVVAVDVTVKLRQGKFEIANQRLEAAGLDPGDVLVVGGAVDGPEFHDVPGLEEDHEVTEIADLLLRIEDGHGGDPEHLVPAGATHRIDAGETSAVADGQLRSFGTRPQIPRHLDLPLAIDHLEHEGQAGHEADHGHEPRGAGVCPDERLDRIEAVDPRRVLQVGAVRVLVALAKAHQRLVRPGVVVEDRDLDDPRLQDGFRIEMGPDRPAHGPSDLDRVRGVRVHANAVRADLHGHTVDRFGDPFLDRAQAALRRRRGIDGVVLAGDDEAPVVTVVRVGVVQCAEDHVLDPADAAAQADARDHAGRNRLERHGRTDVGLARVQARGQQDAGNRRHRTAQDIGQEQRQPRIDAGQARGLDVSADGVEIPAEPGPVDHEVQDRDQDHGDENRGRHTEYRSEAEGVAELHGHSVDRCAAGHVEGEAEADRCHAQAHQRVTR